MLVYTKYSDFGLVETSSGEMFQNAVLLDD